ncbi:hypothetical protein [Clostridium beijerinckii]|uniref:hypothetical protein n=1 Tax=Clostridium beijerinckii TaxID=1520 RepID=UPI001F24BD91|nr:hypothetical protein [Clostridium beijerinckii]
MILAIDPGNIQSGYVLTDNNLKPILKGKIDNEELLAKVRSDIFWYDSPENEEDHIAIEMIASYGMPVGAEVFETCVWIGRFIQAIGCGIEPKFIYRKEEALNLCQSSRANDATIKQALVDRFAKGQKNYGKGTKKEPGWFYEFSKDIWSAYAVAVTYHDRHITKSFK